MAETPDFEQLAREISDNNGIGRLEEWDSETPDAVIAAIAEQLRLVWNARGAADLATLTTVSPEPPEINRQAMVETSPLKARRDWWREGFAAATQDLDRALRNLDR